MRANLIIVLVICSIAVANPTKRKKRQAIYTNPWAQFGQAMAGAFAGTAPFFPMPIPIPFPMFGTGSSGSSSASSATGVNHNNYPNFGWPGFVWPTITFPIPWYNGENVCVETQDAEDPDLFKGFGDVNFGGTVGQKSESCWTSSETYVCRGRKTVNENGKQVSKQYVTKYHCCYGFVRPKDGSPGCIESSVNIEEPSVIELHGEDKLDKRTYYNFVPLTKDPNVVKPAPVQPHATSGAAATAGASAVQQPGVAQTATAGAQAGAQAGAAQPTGFVPIQ